MAAESAPLIVRALQAQMLASAAKVWSEIGGDDRLRPDRRQVTAIPIALADTAVPDEAPPEVGGDYGGLVDEVAALLQRRQQLTGSLSDDAAFRTVARAHAEAVEQTSQLITNISIEQQAAIRSIVGRGFTFDPATGLPDTTRQLAARIEDQLSQRYPSGGLNRVQASALERRQAGVLRNLLDSGRSLEAATRMTENWRVGEILKQRKIRAVTIARTEVMEASNLGRTAGVEEAVAQDLLDSSARRRWSATGGDRMCRICRGLHDKITTLSEPWPGGYQRPPAHPRCRCTFTILPPAR